MIRSPLNIVHNTVTVLYRKHIVIKTKQDAKTLLYIVDPNKKIWIILTKYGIVQFISEGISNKYAKAIYNNAFEWLGKKWSIRRSIYNMEGDHPFSDPLNELKTYFPFGPEEPPIEEVKGLLSIVGI